MTVIINTICFAFPGFNLSKQTLGGIAQQFCGKQGGLDVDDFVYLASKTASLNGNLQKLLVMVVYSLY